MTTPLITKKLEDYYDSQAGLVERKQPNNKVVTVSDFAQALEEAYSAGQANPFYGESVSTLEARPKLVAQARQEVCKEVVEEVEKWLEENKGFTDDHALGMDTVCERILSLIRSKYLTQEDKPTIKK